MGAYESIVSTIMSGLAQDSVADPIIKSLTEEEICNFLDEILMNCEITPTNIPPRKVLWIRLKVMEQVYWKLALASAPMYHISVDGLTTKRETRFEHYMKLIDAIAKQITAMEEGDPTLGGATIKTYDTYADKVYNRNSYITAQNIPTIEVILDGTNEESVNISLDLRQCRSRFLKYRIYYSDSQIIDEYDGCAINENAIMLMEECNIHNNKFRVPITQGHIACVVTLKYGLKAYHELVLGEPVTDVPTEPDVPTENPGVGEDVPGEGEGDNTGEAGVNVVNMYQNAEARALNDDLVAIYTELGTSELKLLKLVPVQTDDIYGEVELQYEEYECLGRCVATPIEELQTGVGLGTEESQYTVHLVSSVLYEQGVSSVTVKDKIMYQGEELDILSVISTIVVGDYDLQWKIQAKGKNLPYSDLDNTKNEVQENPPIDEGGSQE